jgi:hypothetical protein
MSLKQFLQKENIQMLWDVVSDEDIFKFLSPDIQSKIYNLFINNIKGFFEVEKTKNSSLVDVNKKYILLILSHIKQTYPYQPSKIKIHSEPPVKELITYEEIQNDRKSQFDKDFSRRQEEFEDFMAVKAPPAPEFADPVGKTDKPIKEMDKILRDMQAQRNYEIEQINRSYNLNNSNTNNTNNSNTSNNNPVDNWLKPQETSIKSEKFQGQEIKSQAEKNQNQNYSNSRFKFLNELDTDLSTNPKKNVSFSNNDQVNMFISEQVSEDDEENNLFSKLKKINKKEEHNSLQNHEKTFNEEDRLDKLERNMSNLNEKMDKILALLSNK